MVKRTQVSSGAGSQAGRNWLKGCSKPSNECHVQEKTGVGEDDVDGVLSSKVAIAQLLCLWERVSDVLCPTCFVFFFLFTC